MPSDISYTLIKLGMTEDPVTRGYDGDFLQQAARLRLRDIICEHVKHVAKSPEEESQNAIGYPRPHQAILIEGGRGSGKTTFLLKALTQLQEAKGEYESVGKKVHVLPVVDPTLIESKDHIVLLILQLIDDAVDEPSCRSKDTDALDKARAELAEGLGLIDGIGKSEAFGDEWEDARWVMSRGLEKASKARWFERKLNVYIDCALKVLKRQAFVLAFDDVDTNFENGRKILETLRKYLTSPQLVMLLSGDLDLYGRLIRGGIYNTFGKQVLEQESKDPKLLKAVQELEEQYLLKLLPPQHRIQMRPLGALMSKRIEVETANLSHHEIQSWAVERNRALLREGDGQRDFPFLPVLFREHLRLVLTYLRALDDDSLQSSRERVFQVLGTRLIEVRIPTDLMQVRSLDYTLKTCFDWMVNRNQPADLLQFGATADPDETIGLHCLALTLAEVINSPAAAMRGLLTLGLPLALTQQPTLSDGLQRKAVFGFMWGRNQLLMLAGPRLSTMSRGGSSIGRSAYGSIGLASRFNSEDPGIKRVYGEAMPPQAKIADIPNTGSEIQKRYSDAWSWMKKLQEKDQENKGHGDIQPMQNVAWFTIEGILDGNRAHSFTPVLRMLCFRRFSGDGQIMRGISALSLFAAMALILEGRKLASETGDAMAIDANLFDDLALDMVVPHFGEAKAGTALEEDNDTSAKDEDTSQSNFLAEGTAGDKEAYTAFLQSLTEWADFVQALGEDATLSPRMLGAVALRIDDDLRGFDTTKGSDFPVSTGQLLHRQITTILNAIITVMHSPQGRRESPKSSDAPLVRTLQRADKKKPLPSFAVALLSCPLLWAFLNPEETITLNKGTEIKLRDVSLEALKAWQVDWNRRENRGKTEADFETWSKAPKVTVGLRSPSVKEPRSMQIEGFHDLLNVVPRYAETSSGKRRQ